MEQKKVIKLELTAEQDRDYRWALTAAVKALGMVADSSSAYASLMGTIAEQLVMLRIQMESSIQQPGPEDSI